MADNSARITDKAITGYLLSKYTGEELVGIILTGKMNREMIALEMIYACDRDAAEGFDLVEYVTSVNEEIVDAQYDEACTFNVLR